MHVFGVLGLGISGIGVLRLLALDAIKDRGGIVFWDDDCNKRNEAVGLLAQLKLNEELYRISQDFSGVERLFVSPGIDPKNSLLRLAVKNGVKLCSDLDLFYHRLLNAKCSFAQKIIGITGTNGKSTTTALIHHILYTAKLQYSCAGNIGKSICNEPLDQHGYVIELSSYQIDLISEMKLDVGVLLNITPDHLERYGTFNKYVASKKKILKLSQNTILCIDDINNYRIWQKYKKNKNKHSASDKLGCRRIIPISCHRSLSDGFYITDREICEPKKSNKLSMSSSRCGSYSYSTKLLAKCNRQNILAAYVVSRLLGLEVDCILSSIQSFAGLEHRLEYVRSIHFTTTSQKEYRIDFYNDSKATNAQAAIQSINSLDYPLYLLCGGIAKTGGIEVLKPYIHKIRKVYFFGQDAERLMAQWQRMRGTSHASIYDHLVNAVDMAYQDASNVEEDSCILLAPCCASLDQFKNFEDRGKVFKTIVSNY
ncbi:UDP-N-acetylmuramoylalanine--D-glutamate ligase [Rickettsiales endosymbiont of Paramecium tredecaurelia]|uniref:UDP-N-acetylmuramoyl-L-alanine--D-glutamate ligase n=1 Tax=Candidatus Sarmatiella mevalonica TaxID=2770581 RepID=UPI001922DA72|nr:UDP-N-acetylmuramoyl-L-alanine--D-glutamate ligase [Candidatus Sarmatiella mevalonica]MBL3284642.1 UDP-N-acetylmuramoylalanine--D-glutamate ligase [Candidatus Sarmatiella mevalonica]